MWQVNLSPVKESNHRENINKQVFLGSMGLPPKKCLEECSSSFGVSFCCGWYRSRARKKSDNPHQNTFFKLQLVNGCTHDCILLQWVSFTSKVRAAARRSSLTPRSQKQTRFFSPLILQLPIRKTYLTYIHHPFLGLLRSFSHSLFGLLRSSHHTLFGYGKPFLKDIHVGLLWCSLQKDAQYTAPEGGVGGCAACTLQSLPARDAHLPPLSLELLFLCWMKAVCGRVCQLCQLLLMRSTAV